MLSLCQQFGINVEVILLVGEIEGNDHFFRLCVFVFFNGVEFFVGKVPEADLQVLLLHAQIGQQQLFLEHDASGDDGAVPRLVRQPFYLELFDRQLVAFLLGDAEVWHLDAVGLCVRSLVAALRMISSG